MKKLISILMLLMAFTMSSNAMSYEQARQQALFLTDKMAYELNLTNDQYEAAYEINLDYLMSVNTVDDLYGAYWRYRNLDMSYVLLDWQYRAFCDAAYFYRPLYFNAGYWHFGIYARYPHRDYFYFDRPTVYISYCGGHSWSMNRGRSWYHGRSYGPRRGDNHFGMRDGFDRGDYGRGNRQSFGSREPQYISSRPQNSFGSQSNRQQGSFGSRGSSTRTTVKRSLTDNNTNRGQFGSRRGGDDVYGTPRNTFTRPNTSNQSRPSFGNSSRNNTSSFGSRSSFGSSRSNGGSSFSGGTRSNGGSRNSNGGGSRNSNGGGSHGSFGSRR
ncbi:hypothetical protein [uncultured Prevotella sp.]|uniref:hypothetical protein n=1 Tax=uncultured Prevotella sp. TaxID=159272 RepID=UPI0025DC4DAA|nr:hypothetical protein [uncultured Prevotella sp.]